MNNQNALAMYQGDGFDIMQRTAKAMVASGFFEDSKDVAQAVVKVMAGAELGIAPFAAMSGVHIVHGKPTLSSNVIATLVKNDPRYDYRVKVCDNNVCVLTWHESGETVGESTFTIAEAKSAGLTNKPTWKNYASDMLFARALTRGARRYAPGIFGGAPVYTPEEVGADDNGDGTITITRPQTPPAANGHHPEPAPRPEPEPEPVVSSVVADGEWDELPSEGEKRGLVNNDNVKPSAAQMRGFHARGKERYGDEWDTKRPQLVEAVTKGRSKSSKHLTLAEYETLMKGMAS
jgi:hypothetical protein